MSFISQLGLQTAGQVIGAGMGMILGDRNDKRQREQQEYLQKLQIMGNKEMTDYQMKKQLEMWEATNYPAQIKQLEKAGLNPGLIYGMGGAGGATTGGSAAGVSGGSAQQNPGEIQQMMAMGMQIAQQAAQTELTKSQTEKTKVETEKIAGADTENIKADTANKILNSVILDYTGKESKEMFERVNQPNRAVQSETVEKELSARQGIAGTIYELWVEGKLYEKSVAEIENILLNNEKTKGQTRQIIKSMDLLEENIKGAKLDNIIKELETKLQTETGIDKNSPVWMKILGRLFVQLFNK